LKRLKIINTETAQHHQQRFYERTNLKGF